MLHKLFKWWEKDISIYSYDYFILRLRNKKTNYHNYILIKLKHSINEMKTISIHSNWLLLSACFFFFFFIIFFLSLDAVISYDRIKFHITIRLYNFVCVSLLSNEGRMVLFVTIVVTRQYKQWAICFFFSLSLSFDVIQIYCNKLTTVDLETTGENHTFSAVWNWYHNRINIEAQN